MNVDDVLDPTPDISYAAVSAALANVRFPSTKDDIVKFGVINKFHPMMLEVVQQIPENMYNSWDELDYYLRRIPGIT